jgi:hypothetical protein
MKKIDANIIKIFRAKLCLTRDVTADDNAIKKEKGAICQFMIFLLFNILNIKMNKSSAKERENLKSLETGIKTKIKTANKG